MRARGLWRGRIVCVALKKVRMTHATRGLKQSKQPPLSSYLLQLSPLPCHLFTSTSSFHPFMLTPLGEAPSVVYSRLAMVQWRGSGSWLLWRQQCLSGTKPRLVWKWQAQLSESGSVSLLSLQGASGKEQGISPLRLGWGGGGTKVQQVLR